MVLSRIGDFLEHVDEHTEQEILLNMQEIKNYFYDVNYWKYTKEKLEKIFKIVDRNKVLKELFKNEEKFSSWEEKLDIPEKLKFGIEIEFGKVTLDELKSTFETSTISEIMRILEVPTIISDKIIEDSNFEENSDFSKWTFSQELGSDSEVSSPIMKNNLNDLNQIVAISTLLKALMLKYMEQQDCI